MVTFEALDAEHGDCLLLHYSVTLDGQDVPQLWLIDGGPTGTWDRTLRPHLAGLANGGTLSIRLGMVTHIDSDHIGGMKNLVAALVADPRRKYTPDLRFVEFWFNGFERIGGNTAAVAQAAAKTAGLDGAFLESAKEGERLLLDLKALPGAHQLLNPGFADGTIIAPETCEIGEVQIQLVAPTATRIEALREEWAAQLEIPAAQLAAAEQRDDSPTNLSSLAFLATIQGKTILFTGDALADHLIEGWKALNGADPCPIDVMKVPHHGAAGNNSRALFELFPAKHYVFCANGKDGNPDLQTLDWLMETQSGRNYTIHITSPENTPGLVNQKDLLKKAQTNVVWRKSAERSIRIAL